jgi:hypothetical protein
MLFVYILACMCACAFELPTVFTVASIKNSFAAIQ